VRSFDFHQEGDPEPHPELFPKAFCEMLEILIASGDRYLQQIDGMRRLSAKAHGAMTDFERAQAASVDSLHHLKAIHHEVCEA